MAPPPYLLLGVLTAFIIGFVYYFAYQTEP